MGLTSVSSEIQDICLGQTRLDEDTFVWRTCLIPSPSSITNTTDSNINNDNTNNASAHSASSNVNTVDSNASNNTNNNEKISVACPNVNTTEKHNITLKRLIQEELKDEIKEDEERLERKKN
ncbi:hypothetical protein HMPREF1544_10513 [Mucor circinelloides 1006PhL]|uniref:Uncharacterized protein n=1 Tax=Mucor circinelloides f. circinelloides (strain 1006PhL) TaxID=1220926 RepID=S2JSB5_MUCC1|nr:hypothetical protein HMPREF1544_10513 [Mucor circinelloides 1006PhL]